MNNYFKIIKKYVLFFLVLSLTSCLTNVEDEVEIDPCLDITFSVSVKPIIDAHCVQCHGNGGIYPNLTSYNLISLVAGKIKSEVVSREMPKEESLTQDQIDAIVCWVDSGALNN
ncbi:MAG: cytochrome c [Polaribacter sp.]|jgi:hypothetical protein|nr:cytochrome c [Polaribacter sp.]|tara:strand:+ start:2653 stop:2994 length:342 start_codon:yes stop_codon:yes gene_type:complete